LPLAYAEALSPHTTSAYTDQPLVPLARRRTGVDRISTGVLTRTFPPEAVDAAVDAAGVREQWRRLLQPDTRGTITWEADSPGGLMEAWLNFTRWLIKHRRH